LETWEREVERIRRSTGLPIEWKCCPEPDWEQLRSDYEADGYEIVAHISILGNIWHVVIPANRWPASARALLSLILTPHAKEPTLQDEASRWLRGVLTGGDPPLPKRLDAEWDWREQRVCFLLERIRAEQDCDAAAWLQILQDFLPETQVTLLPLTPAYLLLLVPRSALSEQTEPDVLLEWAFSLHDVLSTETGNTVRVLVAPPVAQPGMLADALRQAVSLSRALQRYRPHLMAAGTWQYPLEQWADQLDPNVRIAVQEGLRSILPRMTDEQVETLETLFSLQLNVSETARRLYLHRNTLLYRLDKLTEQTGLDPRQFSHAVLLQLAILFGQND